MFSMVIQRCMWYQPSQFTYKCHLSQAWMQLFFGTDDGVCMFFGGKELYLAVMWSWEVGKKCNFNGEQGQQNLPEENEGGC